MFEKASDDELRALLLLGEARSDSSTAREWYCILQCVQSRLHDRRWPNTTRDVILQPLQFSCFNKTDPNLAYLEQTFLSITSDGDGDDERLFRGAEIVVDVFMMAYEQNIKNSGNVLIGHPITNYLTKKLYESSRCPGWAKKMFFVCEEGDHVFLYEPI